MTVLITMTTSHQCSCDCDSLLLTSGQLGTSLPNLRGDLLNDVSFQHQHTSVSKRFGSFMMKSKAFASLAAFTASSWVT